MVNNVFYLCVATGMQLWLVIDNDLKRNIRVRQRQAFGKRGNIRGLGLRGF